MPAIVAGLVVRGKTNSTKPSWLGRRPIGKVWGEVVGMNFAQDFHLTINFTYDDTVFEVFVRMKILTVVLNLFRDEERAVARGAVRAEGGDAEEGRKLVRHGKNGLIVGAGETTNDEGRQLYFTVVANTID